MERTSSRLPFFPSHLRPPDSDDERSPPTLQGYHSSNRRTRIAPSRSFHPSSPAFHQISSSSLRWTQGKRRSSVRLSSSALWTSAERTAGTGHVNPYRGSGSPIPTSKSSSRHLQLASLPPPLPLLPTPTPPLPPLL